ncbi:dipeptide ABC transporter ATP-binding protein [Natrinema salaciae]|uniref:dipeptide ABC transporter ATP-binding protein n=1 Tax=Natrinema salaciae TaxID=1186196 RepID=UPI000B829CEF|nr:ABC transporter ATP-binding protein [Natrinema salaciae]
MSGPLTVDDLRVRFQTGSETVHAVTGASFEVDPGEIVGLVGESGCGKSVTARSIVRLEAPGEIVGGSIRFDGRELTTADDRTLRRLRGRELAMAFQDPSTALNPAYPVGEQIAEALRIRRNPDRQPFLRELVAGSSSRLRSRTTRQRVLELMETVGIRQPAERIDAYPHEFSGGMRQRAMLALALALARRPSVLIADEPTTALDTTTQAAILDRLATLNTEAGMGMLLISHDLGVVSALCDRIVVMYDGAVVERGPTDELRSNPAHPYTKALLGSLPRRSDPQSRLPTVAGTPSDDAPPSTGCRFADRCPFATENCLDTSQPAVQVTAGHTARCGVRAARDASPESMHGTGVDSRPGSEPVQATSADGQCGPTTPSQDGTGPARSRFDERASDDAEAVTAATADRPLVELESVTKSYAGTDTLLDRILGRGDDEGETAVRNLSLALWADETVGLVGESGCGKSTLARLVAGLEEPANGTIRLRGDQVGGVDTRTDVQLAEFGVVFQHPGRSLDPKRTVGQSVAEPLIEAGWTRSRRRDRIDELLSLVGLPSEYVDRYPRQLSGGQQQRVAIARALALEPSVLILDEPTAALDVSTQATVLNLLADLQDALGFAALFVSHDLEVVRHVADRVAVMYLGQLVEIGPARQVLSRPAHPYTQSLLDAIPGDRGTDRTGIDTLAADPPSPTSPPEGCSFHPRCPVSEADCSRVEPTVETVGEARVRCLYAGEWGGEDGIDGRRAAESENTTTD